MGGRAAGRRLVAVAVPHSLACLAGLKRGRSDARETDPVGPVPDADVDRTLPFLTPTLAAMVRLQRLAGLRPGEVRLLQPDDIDRSVDPWVYAPEHHKMSHLGRDRAAPLGAKAQAILEPLLDGAASDACLFTTAKSKAEVHAAWRVRRKSKVPPSQRDRRKDPADLLRPAAGGVWTNTAYAAAVRRACKKAGVPPWHPNQLRHAFATAVRARYGLEAAKVSLGHKRADVTQGRSYAVGYGCSGGLGIRSGAGLPA